MASQPSALVSGTLPLCILFRLLCGCVFFFLFAQYEWTGGFDLSHVPFCVPFSFFTPLFPLPLSLLTRAQTNCQYVCVCVSLTHFFFHYWCDIPPPLLYRQTTLHTSEPIRKAAKTKKRTQQRRQEKQQSTYSVRQWPTRNRERTHQQSSKEENESKTCACVRLISPVAFRRFVNAIFLFVVVLHVLAFFFPFTFVLVLLLGILFCFLNCLLPFPFLPAQTCRSYMISCAINTW